MKSALLTLSPLLLSAAVIAGAPSVGVAERLPADLIPAGLLRRPVSVPASRVPEAEAAVSSNDRTSTGSTEAPVAYESTVASGGDDDNILRRSVSVSFELFGQCNMTLVTNDIIEGQTPQPIPQLLIANTANLVTIRVETATYDHGVQGVIGYACSEDPDVSLSFYFTNPFIGYNDCTLKYQGEGLSVQQSGNCGKGSGDHPSVEFYVVYNPGNATVTH